MTDFEQAAAGGNEGKQLYDAGKFIEAIPVLKAYLATHPGDVAARALLAASLSQTECYTESIEEFTMLTELEPRNPRHFANLGVVYEVTGAAQKAKELFEKALELNPGYQMAQQRLAALNPIAPSQPSATPTLPERPDVAPLTENELYSSAGQHTASAHQTAAPSSSAWTRGEAPFERSEHAGATMPPTGLNWGAFLLPFFWSIAHRAWGWAVVSFFLAPVGAVVLLITGNKVAYQNRRFTSLQEFKHVQRAWTIWGVVLACVQIALVIFSQQIAAAIVMKLMQNDIEAAQNELRQKGVVVEPFEQPGGMRR